MRWVFWLLASLFYFYEYFLRVEPSVMIPELMRDFSVDGAAVGALSAFYFYVYAPMQLPVGVLTDRYGARKLLALAAFSAGLGSILFAFAHNYWVAALGRFLMGGSSAFGFVGLVYICSHWFREKRRGMLIGLGSSIGTLGAVFGEGPIQILVNKFSWRPVTVYLGIAGIILAGFIALAVRNEPEEMQKYDQKVKKEPEHILENLFIVCKNPHSWLIAVISLLLLVTTPAFAGLWGSSFISTTYGFSREQASFAVSMIFVGWTIGGPFIGKFSDKFWQKKTILTLCSFLGAFLMFLIIYLPTITLLMLYVLLFLVGFFSGGQLLTYSYAIDINTEHTKGTAVAFTNFLSYIGAALCQPFVGYLLDVFWGGELKNGVQVFSPSDFKYAMVVFPISFLLSGIFAMFLKSLKRK